LYQTADAYIHMSTTADSWGTYFAQLHFVL